MLKLNRHLACLALVFLVSACDSQTATTPAARSDAPTSAPAATVAAATATAPAATATAAAPTEASPTDVAHAAVSCTEGLRQFAHTLLVGEALCIPAAPKRVIALDIASLEALLLTGQKPVATAQWILDELPILLPQYAETLKTIDGLGYPAELEKVASLQPDLILAPDDTIDIKLASAIAPVVVPNQSIYADWKLGMQFWSDVLNVQDLYTAMEANYRTRVSELQAALGDRKSQTVSVISVSTYGMSLWMPDSPPGAILADVGLSRPESQSLVGDAAMTKYGESQYVAISMERLDLVDADAIFYFTYAAIDPKIAADESAAIKSFEQQPVWQTLNAFKSEHAFFVPGHWWRSQTYLLANLVIDDLFAHLTDTKATTPVISGR